MLVFVMYAGLSKESSALNCNKQNKSAFCHVRRQLDWPRCWFPQQLIPGLLRPTDGRRRLDVGLAGVIPSQLIQASLLVQMLSLLGLHGQPMLTHECLPQFHWARRIMKPWTLLCGAPLEKNSLSRVTSITGSLARKVLAVSCHRRRGPSAVNWSNKFQSSVPV